jgi:hypothetical protein
MAERRSVSVALSADGEKTNAEKQLERTIQGYLKRHKAHIRTQMAEVARPVLVVETEYDAYPDTEPGLAETAFTVKDMTELPPDVIAMVADYPADALPIVVGHYHRKENWVTLAGIGGVVLLALED